MYCPKCSQQQPSDQTRFCSRCGFPLSNVALLLINERATRTRNNDPASGSVSASLSASLLTGFPRTISVRRRMAVESMTLTIVAWALGMAITFLFDYGGLQAVIAKLAALIFFVLGLVGLVRFLGAFLFVKEPAERLEPELAEHASFGGTVPEKTPLSALPPQQRAANDDIRRNTREMVPRVSVTENTTQLLDDDAISHS